MTRYDVRGTRVSALSCGEAADAVVRLARAGGGGTVCLANVHVVETARRVPELASALADADLVLPDGAPVAWAMRRSGACAERVAGADLLDAVLGRRADSDLRHFFLGARADVLDRVVAACKQRHSRLALAGAHAPPYASVDEFDLGALARVIRDSRADVVWLGLGAPKQEIVAARLRPTVDAVLIGVGAVFDFLSGEKRRAPSVLQRAGLEWAHRLASEPMRLGPRYVRTNASFLVGFAMRGAAAAMRRPTGV